jgi:hypothetical protein
MTTICDLSDRRHRNQSALMNTASITQFEEKLFKGQEFINSSSVYFFLISLMSICMWVGCTGSIQKVT